ncbi:hypothetical protein NQ317_014609 [Molorchus minor]|uniref:Uncharacterized protein n=1 Tax=Molorchus minor TaxID=1323400 RepID=A0ABQ9JMI1_9CUCU|nr:hypothetical protein NQ317_014609 [Molorchus minor]
MYIYVPKFCIFHVIFNCYINNILIFHTNIYYIYYLQKILYMVIFCHIQYITFVVKMASYDKNFAVVFFKDDDLWSEVTTAWLTDDKCSKLKKS